MKKAVAGDRKIPALVRIKFRSFEKDLKKSKLAINERRAEKLQSELVWDSDFQNIWIFADFRKFSI